MAREPSDTPSAHPGGGLNIDPNRPLFAFRRKNEAGVWVCTGSVESVDRIDDIPLRTGEPPQPCFDSVSLIPFAQARERGFPVHDGDEPISVLRIAKAEFHPLGDVLAALPRQSVEIGDVSFDTTSEQYEAIIERIVREEIGTGVGANFVIARRCTASLAGFTAAAALSIFRSLLTQEYGTYWTFIFSTGEKFVLGATPERHISVAAGDVMMNPISGTFRKAGDPSLAEQRRFLEFLDDPKEIFELFMVTDEELKIMCELCEQGGAIVGPLLKEMSKVIHTEYLLLGRSDRTLHELLRQSMYAPTVTGSPVLSAFRTIHRYELESRGYYGATIALVGRGAAGELTLDAPITIRTLEIDASGNLVIRVGATLVRDSDPATEVRETEAKIAGVLDAIRTRGAPAHVAPRLLEAVDPEAVQISLQHRNLYLSRFWFEPQSLSYNAVPELVGRAVTIVDAEDGFSNMLKRLIGQMGADVRVVGYADYRDDGADLTVMGPGPGNPNLDLDPKISRLRAIIEDLLARRRPLFAECLSHQILCRLLGLTVKPKNVPFQGAQRVIDLFGRAERVGFYNTFSAYSDTQPRGVPEVARDAQTQEVHAIRGRGVYSVQFHPESILTPRGYPIVRDALVYLLRPPPTATNRANRASEPSKPRSRKA